VSPNKKEPVDNRLALILTFIVVFFYTIDQLREAGLTWLIYIIMPLATIVLTVGFFYRKHQSTQNLIERLQSPKGMSIAIALIGLAIVMHFVIR